MQQSIYNFLKQNRLLMKISAKYCRTLGSPSQQGIDNKRDESDRELHIMVTLVRTICNIQVLSHRHRGEKSIGRIACLVALSSIFTE